MAACLFSDIRINELYNVGFHLEFVRVCLSSCQSYFLSLKYSFLSAVICNILLKDMGNYGIWICFSLWVLIYYLISKY